MQQRYVRRRRHVHLVRESPSEYMGTESAPEDVDPDTLDDLADEITTLAAHIHAATARLLDLIAKFDRLRGWERGGHRSCAHWLAFRTGIGLPTAREKVRAARALTELPRTRGAMARGELSFSKVRALTRAATPENEEALLDFARGCTTAQTERMVRAWKKHSRAEEADLERELHETRNLSVFPDDEGMSGPWPGGSPRNPPSVAPALNVIRSCSTFQLKRSRLDRVPLAPSSAAGTSRRVVACHSHGPARTLRTAPPFQLKRRGGCRVTRPPSA